MDVTHSLIPRHRFLNNFAAQFFLAVYVLCIVLGFWNHTLVLSLLLIAGLLLNLFLWKEKIDLVVMGVAAFLGTSTEIFCVYKGVWTYKAPHLMLGVPLWLPFVWAYLFCLFRRVSITIVDALDFYFPLETSYFQKILICFQAVLVILYSVFTLVNISRPIAAVYAVFLVISFVFWRTRTDLMVFVFGGICGTLGEFLCMKLGYWIYHYPFFRSIGLPLSLPLAWGLSSIIITRLSRMITPFSPRPESS